MQVRATAKVRSNFSIPHLIAAALFSRQVSAIEKENHGKPLGAFWDDIRAFSTGCVFTSIASLESYVNELFVDSDEHFPAVGSALMQKLWTAIERQPLLEKYEFALLLKNGSGFAKGAKPYQDIDTLIKLRNALIHFSPEWEDAQVDHAKLSKQLKHRFAPSPFMGAGDPLFPKGWATSGCTKWAVKSTIAFVYKFEELAGMQHRLDKFTDRLKLK